MIGKLLKTSFLIVVVSTAWIWVPLLLLTSPLWAVPLVFCYSFIKAFGLGDLVQRMISWAMNLVFLKFSCMRRLTWKTFYNVIANQVPSSKVKCMNCGFKALRSEEAIELPEECQFEKYSYQMYHYVSTGLGAKKTLEGLHILEVGSGRGGGLEYVARYLKPKSAVGIDLSKAQVNFSKKHCSNVNLMYAQGLAENLKVKDSSVDVVICIESSHCFADVKKFMDEVFRVLVKGGHLYFADMRFKEDFGELNEQFRASRLALVKKHDITEQVVAALLDDADRRRSLIKKLVPVCKL